jgi:hypothetical protein
MMARAFTDPVGVRRAGTQPLARDSGVPRLHRENGSPRDVKAQQEGGANLTREPPASQRTNPIQVLENWLAGGSRVRLAPPSCCAFTSRGEPGPPTARPPSAKKEAEQHWGSYTAAAKRQCQDQFKAGGFPSYVEMA